MQIINLKRSGLVKHVGTGLIGLAMSLGANAMDQHQHKGKELQKEVCKEPVCEKFIEKPTKEIKVPLTPCNQAQEKVKEVCKEPASQTCEKAVEKAVQICAKQEVTKICQEPAQKIVGKEVQVDPCQQNFCPEQIFLQVDPSSSSSSSESSSSSSSSSSSEEEDSKTVPYTPSCELQKDCSNFNWADFSLYINESQFPKKSLTCTQNFCTTADHRQAKNFWIQDLRDVGGHHISRHSHGSKNWNSTQFTNFRWHGVHAHSLKVGKQALWSNFVINGDITDLNFKNSTLDTGMFFDSRLSKARFINSTLRNITFHNVKFVKTKNVSKAKHRRSTFNNSILDNARFIECDLGHTTFKDTTFVGNTFFQNSALRFKRHFVGSKWVDADGKTHVLTEAVANELDRRHQTYVMNSRQSMSSAQIIQSMKLCQSYGK